jgi:hypothetical protein
MPPRSAGRGGSANPERMTTAIQTDGKPAFASPVEWIPDQDRRNGSAPPEAVCA